MIIDKKRLLIVVDMQNDFIDGALGTAEAAAIVPNVRAKLEHYRANGDIILFTRDTHSEDYLDTQEGRRLPVPHCVKGAAGWELSPLLDASGCEIIDKPSFGSAELVHRVSALDQDLGGLASVELVGLCTDICVIVNALLIKTALPETPVAVDASCCAGVTPQSHRNALEAMKMCQIDIINS